MTLFTIGGDSGIVGGRYYEVDGKVVVPYSFSQGKWTVQDATGNTKSFTVAEFMERAKVASLQDFPELLQSNPRLPYVFDLLWDVKRPSGADHVSALETDFFQEVRTNPEVPTKCEEGSPLHRLLLAAGREHEVVVRGGRKSRKRKG